MDALKMTTQLINLFQSIRSTYDQNERDILYFDNEYTDLTHALELTKFNAAEGYRLAKQLQENRKNRRWAKDQNYQLQPLYELVGRYQEFFNNLKRTQANVEKIKDTQQKRIYTPRARTDMQEAFARANEKRG